MNIHMHVRIKYFARKTYLLKHGLVSARTKAVTTSEKARNLLEEICAIVAVKAVSFPVSLETAENLLINIAFLYSTRVLTQRQPI